MPPRVREVVSRRLDRLGERAQHVAAVAAVIGRAFDFALLQRAAGMAEDDAAQGMEELVRRRVLHGVGERFDFTHDRIREVAYDRILGPRRRLLHRRVAEAIEALYADSLDDHALALGLHYREGEVWDRAARYLGTAGNGARERAANREAVACFDAVLQCLRRLPEDRERSERVVDTILQQETALMGLGEFRRSLEGLRDAEALARGLGDRVRLGRVFGRVAYNLGSIGDLDSAQSTRRSRRAPSRPRSATPARSWPATSCSPGRCTRAATIAGRWRPSGRTTRLRVGWPSGELLRLNVSFSRTWGVLALAELGEFAEAIARGDEALRVSDAEFGRHADAWAHLGVGRLYLVKGDLTRAIEVLERGLPLCEAGGELAVYFSRTAASLGGAYALSGRLDEAVSLLERADRHADSIGFAYGHALVVTTLAEATLLAGDVETAACAADRGLTLARRQGQRGWEAWALRVQGEIAAAAGDRATAGAHYREALALAAELGMRPLAAHCHFGLGRVTGDRVALTAACQAYRALEMTHWVPQAERLLPA